MIFCKECKYLSDIYYTGLSRLPPEKEYIVDPDRVCVHPSCYAVVTKVNSIRSREVEVRVKGIKELNGNNNCHLFELRSSPIPVVTTPTKKPWYKFW